jgi:hypothetical protein
MSSLAAARADNFYYPPDFDPKKGSLNKVSRYPSHLLNLYMYPIHQSNTTLTFSLFDTIAATSLSWCTGKTSQ